MAIKSKGRAKGRQVARPPRREPVVVKAPFFMRKWVQLVGAILAGAAVVLVAAWVIHGLRQDRARSLERQQTATKLAAATKWRSAVEGAVSAVGTLGQGGQPPSVLPQVTKAIGVLQKGDSPKGTAHVMDSATASAAKAADTLTKFDLAGTVSQKGFQPEEALAFVDSKDGLSAAFRLYGDAASIARSAAEATGGDRVVLGKAAAKILAEASTQLSAAWSSYQQALYAGGINLTGPLGPTGGVPGAGAPTP
jgi:hypothetical protein